MIALRILIRIRKKYGFDDAKDNRGRVCVSNGQFTKRRSPGILTNNGYKKAGRNKLFPTGL